MDVARQIVRWSIPAAHLVVTLLAAELIVAVVFIGETGGFAAVNGADSVVSIGVVLAGVPIGFLLYQLYFFAYDTVLPRFRFFIGVPPDRGLDILRTLSDDQRAFVELELGLRVQWKDLASNRRTHWLAGVYLPRDSYRRRRVYARRRETNWRITRWLIMRYFADLQSPRWSEYQGLTDLYHGLGTCRIATLASGLFFLVYNLRVHGASAISHVGWDVAFKWTLTGLLVSFWYIGVIFVLGRARRGTGHTMEHDVVDGLRHAIPGIGDIGRINLDGNPAQASFLG